MHQYLFTFVAACFPVFTSMQTLIAYTDGDYSLVTNTIITLLAGAVAVLWKRVEANYKKLERENSELKFNVTLANTKIEECETDRKDLRVKVEALEKQGCTLAHICEKRDKQ